MNKRKVMAVFGTRPEAVKMAPLVKELQKHPEWFDTKVVVTAQHREMLDQVLEHFQIVPDHDLNIMQQRQTLAGIVVRALEGLDQVMEQEKPDVVLVHGDTHTTFVASLAAFYHQTAVGHVEAGLRTYEKYSPWPEEMNRRLTDVLSDLYFAPTSVNVENLRREGVPEEQIYLTGQTGVDALQAIVSPNYRFVEPALNHVDFARHRVIAVTAHRRENWGEPHRNMFQAMLGLLEALPDTYLVYPVHKSPAVREQVDALLRGHPRVLLTDPVEYPDMVNLMARSALVMTDSGGIQEETPSLGVPLVLMRDTTERPEGVQAGVVVMAGKEREPIFQAAYRLLTDVEAYQAMARRGNPYGDGRASERIVAALAYHFGLLADRPEAFQP